MRRLFAILLASIALGSLYPLAQAKPPQAVGLARAAGRHLQSAEARAAEAAEGRLPVGEAYAYMHSQACGEVYDDCQASFEHCLAWLEHADPAPPDDEPAPSAGDAEGGPLPHADPVLHAAHELCLAEGLLRSRMPLCIEALAMFLQALRDGDEVMADLAKSLGERACHPQALCRL